MKGLELSEKYYEECGKPVLEREFPELLPLLAVGFVGSGSERYGFDDEISRDHDFEPGFCLFLPDESVVDRRQEFLLERAYAKLPKEFEGVRRQPISPVGGSRNGPIRTAEFYLQKVGAADGALSVTQWLHIPDYALAEATNGKVFYDGYGEFTRIRKILSKMPEDVRRKRIAGNLLLMAQAGQYNYTRCLRHGEPQAAALALAEFVNAAIKTVFLLEGRYAPYYKWSFRAMRQLPGVGTAADDLSVLLSSHYNEQTKCDTVEKVAADVIARLHAQGLTDAVCGDLEKHAYSVNDHVSDGEIRNLHILEAV